MAETARTESLERQLTELNSRSRWYSSQLWQLPFAYLGLTAVTVVQLVDKKEVLPYGLITASVVGILSFVHLLFMQNGNNRAVESLREVEGSLNLKPTAEVKPFYEWPFLLMLVLAALGCFLGGMFLLWKERRMFDSRWLEVIGLGMQVLGTVLLTISLWWPGPQMFATEAGGLMPKGKYPRLWICVARVGLAVYLLGVLVTGRATL